MNKDEIINFKDLSAEQQKKVIIWSYDLGKHTICYPKKLFWIFHKNIPIADENQNIYSFDKFNLALDMLSKLKFNQQSV